MPRNTSGVYQLPAGNPVVSGTLIESANWANPTLTDIAQALTESLDRFGRSTMAAPLLLNDGTISGPGLGFGSESSTGLYKKSSKVFGFTVGGTEVFELQQNKIVAYKDLSITGALTVSGATSFTGALALQDGTAAAPAVYFTADTNTGLYRPGADSVGWSVGGVSASILDATGLTLPGGRYFKGSGTTGGGFAIGATDPTGGLVLTGAAPGPAWVDLDPEPDNGSLSGTDSAIVRMFRQTTTTGVRNFAIFRGDGSVTYDHSFSAGNAGMVANIARNGGRVVFGTKPDDGSSDFQATGLTRINGSIFGQLGVRDGGTPYGGSGPDGSFDGLVIDSAGNTGLSILTPTASLAGIAFGDNVSNKKGQIQYDNTANVLHIATTAIDRLTIGAAGTTFLTQILASSGSAGAPGQSFAASADMGLFRASATALGVAVGGAEKMRVLANTDASVLIGATTPQAASAGRGLLELNGASSSYYVCDIAGSIGAVFGHDGTNLSIQAQLGVMRFLTGGAEKGRFTTNPGELLVGVGSGLYADANTGAVEVNGVTTSTLAMTVAGAKYGYVQAGGAAAAVSLVSFAANPVRVLTNNAEKVRVTASSMAELCVGITAPFASLGSRGNISLNGTSQSILALGVNGVNTLSLQSTGTQCNLHSVDPTAPIVLMLNSVAKLTVSNTAITDNINGGLELGFRQIPPNTKATPYTPLKSDNGRCIVVTSTGNILWGAGIYAAGDVVSVYNNAGGNIALVPQTATIKWGTGAGVVSTGTRTLAANGFCTLYWIDGTIAKLTGDGIT